MFSGVPSLVTAGYDSSPLLCGGEVSARIGCGNPPGERKGASARSMRVQGSASSGSSEDRVHRQLKSNGDLLTAMTGGFSVSPGGRCAYPRVCASCVIVRQVRSVCKQVKYLNVGTAFQSNSWLMFKDFLS